MRWARLAWPALMFGALLALLELGDERLAVPLHSLNALSAWAADTPPADLAASLLRGLAIVLAGYLFLAATLALAADAMGLSQLAGAVLRVSLPRALQRLVTGTAGLGLAAGSVVLTNTSPAGATPLVTTVLAEEPPLPSVAIMRLLGQEPSPTATMVVLDAAPPEVPEASPEMTDDEWLVGPGDSFWAIAEEVLNERPTPPDDTAIAQYCRHLIAANHNRLAQPAQPDLLFPGQLLTLPPPPQ